MERKEIVKDWEDTKLIECANCFCALNGKSLWVVTDSDPDPKILCEDCYKVKDQVKAK